MNAVRVALCAGTVLTFMAAGFAALAGQRQPAPLRASDLPGTYELVDRVLVSGKVLRRPDIAGLYTFGHERANLNLFIRNADGTLASESSIIRYTLCEKQYCEWIEYTTRNNLDAPGITNEAPPVSSHCTPIKVAGHKVILSPPGESVMTTYDRSFTRSSRVRSPIIGVRSTEVRRFRVTAANEPKRLLMAVLRQH